MDIFWSQSWYCLTDKEDKIFGKDERPMEHVIPITLCANTDDNKASFLKEGTWFFCKW